MGVEVPPGMVVADISIQRTLDDEGNDRIWFKAVDAGGDVLPLVTILGLLRMSEDTAIREAMGETDA